MRYRVENLGATLGTTYKVSQLPRLDQILVSLGLAAYPGDASPHKIKWRACYDLVGATAPGYEAGTTQGLTAISCINDLLRTMGRAGEIIEVEPDDPAPGVCTPNGVRMTQDQGGYAGITCPTGPDCHNIIDGLTGRVIIRDISGSVAPNEVCSRWGFKYGEPAGGYPPGGGTGGGGTTTGGAPGGGADTPATGQPGSGTYVPANLPGGMQQPQGQGAPVQEIIPEKKTVDKSGLVGAGLGILAVVGAAIYGAQK